MNQKSCDCTSTHTFKGTSDLSESSPLASYWQLVDRFSPEKGWRCSDTLHYGVLRLVSLQSTFCSHSLLKSECFSLTLYTTSHLAIICHWQVSGLSHSCYCLLGSPLRRLCAALSNSNPVAKRVQRASHRKEDGPNTSSEKPKQETANWCQAWERFPYFSKSCVNCLQNLC